MSYQGHIVPLLIGKDGLTGTKDLAQVKPTQLIVANGVCFDQGPIQKEGGAAKYNSTAVSGSPQIIGGWDFWPNASTQHMVVMGSNGIIYRDAAGAGTFTHLASGLTATGVAPVFVEGGKEQAANNAKLFCFTGKNPVKVLSATGAAMTSLASGPADWSGANQPTFGLIHEGRLTGGGNANDPHRWYYSWQTNHERFSATGGGGSLAVFPGEGSGLVGGLSYKGLVVLWKKPRGIYVVDTTDPAVANWKVFRLSRAVGMPGALCAVVVDDDVLFMDETGSWQMLSAVKEFGDVTSKNLSQIADMAPFIRDNVNLGRLNQCQAVYYPAKREAHFALPTAGNTVNTARLVVDFNRLDLPRFRWSDRDTAISLWMRRDTNGILRPTMGSVSGFVWKLDQDSKDVAGAGYVGTFQSAHLDMSHVDPKFGTMRKTGDFLELVVNPKGNWDVTVEIFWDGAFKQAVAFNMGQAGGALGSFVLDTDTLGSNAVLNKKRRITGSGRRFSFSVSNGGADQDFSITQAYLHFRPTDERVS